MSNQDRAMLVPIEQQPEHDPDDTPTQRIRFEDLDGPDKQRLLDTLQRLDEEDESRAREPRPPSEGGRFESAGPSLSPLLSFDPRPTSGRRHDWTPVVAFVSGFGVLALAQLAWWLLA